MPIPVTFLGLSEDNQIIPLNEEQRDSFSNMVTDNFEFFTKENTVYKLLDLKQVTYPVKGDNTLTGYRVKLGDINTRYEILLYIGLSNSEFQLWKRAVKKNNSFFNKLTFEQRAVIISAIIIAIFQTIAQPCVEFLFDLWKNYLGIK